MTQYDPEKGKLIHGLFLESQYDILGSRFENQKKGPPLFKVYFGLRNPPAEPSGAATNPWTSDIFGFLLGVFCRFKAKQTPCFPVNGAIFGVLHLVYMTI